MKHDPKIFSKTAKEFLYSVCYGSRMDIEILTEYCSTQYAGDGEDGGKVKRDIRIIKFVKGKIHGGMLILPCIKCFNY